MIIKDIQIIKISSAYGDGKVFGQPAGKKSIIVVKIISKCGLTGVGETYASIYAPKLVENILKIYKKKIINKEFSEKYFLSEELDLPFIAHNGIFKSSRSAIEIALYDLISQEKQEPLYKTLNSLAKNRPLEVYASSGSVIFDEDQIQSDVEYILGKNFKSYKMRIGLKNIYTDIKRIKKSREVLGNNNLMLDAIMGTLKQKWDINQCLENIEMIKEFKPLWLEEPLNPQDVFAYKNLVQKSDIDIAFGESFTSYNEFLFAIENQSSNYLQPDVTNCGYLDLIKLFNSRGSYKNFNYAMHVWGSPISLLANMHFALAYEKITYLELPMVKLEFLNNKIKDLYTIKEGKFEYDDRNVGIGIKLEENDIKNFDYIDNSGFEI